MRYWLFVTSSISVCIFFACTQLYAAEKKEADKSQKSEPPNLVVLHAVPVFQSGQYIARVDAGKLNAGSEFNVRVEIESPSNEPISFKAINPICACFDARVSSMSLSPNEVITLDFRASVPRKTQRVNAAWGIFLEPDTETGLGGIHINVGFEVAGLLSFDDKRLVLEASSREVDAEFNLPMMLTMPVESGNVMVHLPESLKSVKTKVLTKDGKNYLNLIVPYKLLETTYVSGEISCMDSTTGMEDTIYCVIKAESPAAIYPSILRGIFADDGSATVSAMVRVGPSKRSDADENKHSSLIDATFNNMLLPLELTTISETCFRATVKLAAPVIDSMKNSGGPEIHWTIRSKEDTHELRSVVSFVD
jgi:hypothetical protein